MSRSRRRSCACSSSSTAIAGWRKILALLEMSVAWAEAEGNPDGWFHEELAESYAALGRSEEAAEHSRRALAILPDADPSFGRDSERGERLRDLAASRG